MLGTPENLAVSLVPSEFAQEAIQPTRVGPARDDSPGAEADLKNDASEWPIERWLVFHALALAATAVVWLIDEPVFRFFNQWYNGPTPLNGEVHQLILSLAMYGQALGIVAAVLLIWLFDWRQRGRVLVLCASLAAVGIGSSTVKMLIGRDRPTDCGGKTVVHGPRKGITQSRHQSFPSGHTATAFALSLCLSRFYPRFAPMAWTLAVGVGLNRVITVRHFPSDVVGAAWIGFSLTAGVLRVGWLQRWSILANSLCSPDSLRMTLQRWSPWSAIDRFRAAGAAWIIALPRRTLQSAWLLAIVSLAIQFSGNGRIWLWDRDEPRFAAAAREMSNRGDWIVPTFNGELRPDKPIAIYWLMRLAYQTFGDGPFAARFFSAVGAAAACMLAVKLGTMMYDRKVGLLAGWMLALSPMLVIEGKLATVDAVLLALILGCQILLWRVVVSHGAVRTGSARLLWVVLGFAVLTKGPVALAIVGLTAVGYGVLCRDGSWVRRLKWIEGIGLFAVVVLPWVIWIQLRTEGEFLRLALGHHVARRALSPLENHSGFPGYYVVSLLGLMAPWAWLLPWAIVQTRREIRRDARVAFCASWTFGTLLLFEAVRTKLVHYVLPAYPAIAIWLAATILGRHRFARPAEQFLIPRWFAGGLRLAGAVIATTALAASTILFSGDMAVATAVVGALAGGAMFIAGELLARDQPMAAMIAGGANFAAAWIVAGFTLVPIISRNRMAVDLAAKLAEYRAAGQVVALWQYREPSLIYNLKSTVPVVDPMQTEPTLADSIALARQKGAFICPMTEADLGCMRKDPELSTRIVGRISRSDLAGMRCKELLLVQVRPADSSSSGPNQPTHSSQAEKPHREARLR